MITFWIVLFITMIITVAAEFVGEQRLNRLNLTLNSNYEMRSYKHTNKMLFVFAVVFLIVIAGLRSSVGDTGYYLYSFQNLPVTITNILDIRDWGYTIYSSVIKIFFKHPQSILLVSSILTLGLISKTLYNKSKSLSYSVFLFITSGIYLSTMNGLRQYLAGAILFFMIDDLINNRKKKYFIWTLILSTVHASALVMIPVFYLVREEAWSKKVILLMFLSLMTFLSFDYLFGFFSWILSMTQYDGFVDSFGTVAYSGTNILRIFVAFVPVALGFIFRKKLAVRMPNFNIYMNFSLLNFIVLLFASYNWIFARLSIYFGLYNLIFLPGIFYFAFNKKIRLLIMYVAAILYLIFFYFETRDIVYASHFLDINRNLIGPLTRTMY